MTNDNGGTAVPTAWTLAAAGPTPISGDHRLRRRSPTRTVNAGTYTLAESGGPAGYTAGAWSCTGGTADRRVAGVAAQRRRRTCTINNNDQPAHLTLTKVVDAGRVRLGQGAGGLDADRHPDPRNPRSGRGLR